MISLFWRLYMITELKIDENTNRIINIENTSQNESLELYQFQSEMY